MSLLSKWHVWLAWLAGIPILMWTVSGLVMVVKPIEEVRGNHLRVEAAEAPLALQRGTPMVIPDTGDMPVKSIGVTMQSGAPVTRVDYANGGVARFTADGTPIAPLDGDDARALVAEQIIGGDEVTGAEFFRAENVPIDFRRPLPVWRIELADKSYVYVGRDTGKIEAVRTRWWRVFDTMWGLHIMDLETRSKTSHPVLIVFTALAVLVALLGTILMFRRRRTRVTAA